MPTAQDDPSEHVPPGVQLSATGLSVGRLVGLSDGKGVGRFVGNDVGSAVGTLEGKGVGRFVGNDVGSAVGTLDDKGVGAFVAFT